MALIARAFLVFLFLSGAGFGGTTEEEVARYAGILAKLRAAALKFFHTELSETTMKKIREQAETDMRVRFFYRDKALEEGMEIKESEKRAYRDERESLFVREDVLREVLGKEGIPEAEYDRLVEVEYMARKYTHQTILPSIRPGDAQIQEYYDRNRNDFFQEGGIVADIVLLSCGPGIQNETLILWEDLKVHARTLDPGQGIGSSWEGKAKDPCTLTVKENEKLSPGRGGVHREYYRLAERSREGVIEFSQGGRKVLIRVRSRTPDGISPLADVKERIREILVRENFQKAVWEGYREGRTLKP